MGHLSLWLFRQPTRTELRLCLLSTETFWLPTTTRLRRVLRRTLDALAFEVAESSNGEQALKQVETHQFHAILLDVNMPGAGGIATCREMRRKDPRLQILMLTVRDREADKIEALDAGADDYITKPFSIPELRPACAPPSAAPRRLSPIRVHPSRSVILSLTPHTGTVRKAGSVLRLTPKEFDLLQYLMKPPRLAFGPCETSASGLGRRVRAGIGVPAHIRAPTPEKAGR